MIEKFAPLVFKTRAGGLLIFLNVVKNVFNIIPISFLSSPRLPCNQCPTNKKQKSSSIIENLSSNFLEIFFTSLYKFASAPSNNTSLGFSNFNWPTTCFVLLSNWSKPTFSNTNLENSDVNIVISIRLQPCIHSAGGIDASIPAVIPTFFLPNCLNSFGITICKCSSGCFDRLGCLKILFCISL